MIWRKSQVGLVRFFDLTIKDKCTYIRSITIPRKGYLHKQRQLPSIETPGTPCVSPYSHLGQGMADIIQKPLRVRIFIDFWNFSLSVRSEDNTFKIDWTKVAQTLTNAVGALPLGSAVTFEALHVYGSYDPNKPDDAKFKNWFTNWLDRQPGVHTSLVERQKKKSPPKCPHCQGEVPNCSSCNGDMRGTEEKGVDTRIVTDMISLAWSGGYDIAVIVSSDRDFVPVAEFLQSKAIKVIHAAFPPKGSLLSQKSWGHFSVIAEMANFKLPT